MLTNGLGADCVIVAAASKSSAPCEMALEICRDRGKIVIVGAVEMNFPWQEMYMKEIQVLMSRALMDQAVTTRSTKCAGVIIRSRTCVGPRNGTWRISPVSFAGLVDLRASITHEFNLEDAPRAYQLIKDGTANSLGILLRYPQADYPTEPEKVTPQLKVHVPGKSKTGSEDRSCRRRQSGAVGSLAEFGEDSARQSARCLFDERRERKHVRTPLWSVGTFVRTMGRCSPIRKSTS